MTQFGPSIRWRRALAVLIAAPIVLASCGTASSPTPKPPVTVDVNLQEWAVVPGSAEVAAGEVTFAAKNTGPTDKHEMVVVKTDLGARGLAVKADGSADEEGTGVTMIGEIEEFAVGTSASGAFTLTPGKYVLFCNIVDDDGDAHYAKGMSIDFTVK